MSPLPVFAVAKLTSLLLAFGSASAAAEPPLLDPLQAGWKGEPVCELLEENEHLRALRCSFPPGVGHERHFHAPNWGYCVSGGRMRIIDASGVREVELTTGSSFSSAGTAWHEALNIGDTPVVYLIIEPLSAD